MDDGVITVSLEEVKRIVDRLRKKKERIMTIDVIREYCGGFFANKGITEQQLFNTRFGRILNKYESYLGIRKTDEGVAANDDRGIGIKLATAESTEWSFR